MEYHWCQHGSFWRWSVKWLIIVPSNVYLTTADWAISLGYIGSITWNKIFALLFCLLFKFWPVLIYLRTVLLYDRHFINYITWSKIFVPPFQVLLEVWQSEYISGQCNCLCYYSSYQSNPNKCNHLFKNKYYASSCHVTTLNRTSQNRARLNQDELSKTAQFHDFKSRSFSSKT